MLILCDKCIRMLKSRGETVFEQGFHFGEDDVCDFCDTPDDLSGVIVVGDEIKFND